MHVMGRAAVKRPKIYGSWDFLNYVDTVIEPSGFAASLNDVPQARANFDAFSRSSRRGIHA